jgi:hypothetical protein
MLELLQANAGLLKVLLTVVYFAVTLAMVMATMAQVRIARETLAEMRTAREAEIRPDCFLDIRCDGEDLLLVLVNQGRSSAFDIVLRFDQDPIIRSDYTRVGRDAPERLAEISFVNKPVPVLAPRSEIKELIGSAAAFFRSNDINALPELTGTLSYRDPRGGMQERSLRFNLAPYRARRFIITRGLDDLIAPLEKLQRHLNLRPHRPRP